MGKWGITLFAAFISLILIFIIPNSAQESFAVPSSIPNHCHTVKVKINILKDSDWEEADLVEAVKTANQILKKLNCTKLKATIMKLDNNGPDEKLPNGDPNPNNNGMVDDGELSKFRKDGLEELQKIDGKKKGDKIWVVEGEIKYKNKDGVFKPAWGLASESNSVFFVTHIDGHNSGNLGTQIAHEFAHKLGLKHSDVTPDDPDDNKNSNPMHGDGGVMKTYDDTFGPETRDWSDKQKEKVEEKGIVDEEAKNIRRLGLTFPATVPKTQFAAVLDDLDDQTGGKGGIFDINHVVMTSEEGDDNLSIRLALGGTIPTSGVVETVVSVLFDIDDDFNTGIEVLGFSEGFDREARIEFFGDLDTEPLTIQGDLIDWNANTAVPLTFEKIDLDQGPVIPPGEVGLDGPFATAFQIDIPKSSLGLSVNEVPAGIITWEFTSGTIFDDAFVIFDRKFGENRPSLNPSTGIIQPGQTLFYTLDGLTPDTNFELFVDDDLVDGGITDPNGDFAGNFDFPNVPDDIYFITAQDDMGWIAFNVINAGPDPDGDGISNKFDNCPDVFNQEQIDTNGDGVGDACENGPTEELCDGIDNDNDEMIDEDFPNLGDACSAGVGECTEVGVFVCTQDGLGTECNAVPGNPEAEVCDNLDNNCNGQTDEDFADLGNTCTVGIGVCQNGGTIVCSPNQQSTECDAVPGNPEVEVCDTLDNDCDGQTDEEFPEENDVCFTGVGQCERPGDFVCNVGNLECTAVPGPPEDELCDDLDNDCDGITDEDFAGVGDNCTAGVGVCENQGTVVCSDDKLSAECNAIPGSPKPEVCDSLDNDCNGIPDDGLICKLPDGGPVGGKTIPIESTSLILAGAQTFSWMIPVVLSVLGIGLFVVSRKSN